MNAHLQPTGSAYFIAKETEKPETHTLSVLVDNEPGVLARVDRAVLRPRLQHREPDRLGDGAREAPVAHHHRDARHPACAGADQAPARAHRAGAPGASTSRCGRPSSVRTGRSSASWPWSRYRGPAMRASRRSACRSLPRQRDRRQHRALHLRDHRQGRQDRAVHRHHEAARPGRGLPTGVAAMNRGPQAM